MEESIAVLLAGDLLAFGGLGALPRAMGAYNFVTDLGGLNLPFLLGGDFFIYG